MYFNVNLYIIPDEVRREPNSPLSDKPSGLAIRSHDDITGVRDYIDC